MVGGEWKAPDAERAFEARGGFTKPRINPETGLDESESQVGLNDKEYDLAPIQPVENPPVYTKEPHKNPAIEALRREVRLRAQGRVGDASMAPLAKQKGPLGLLLALGDDRERKFATAVKALEDNDYDQFRKLSGVPAGGRWGKRAGDLRQAATETFSSLLDEIVKIDPQVANTLKDRWPVQFKHWEERLQTMAMRNVDAAVSGGSPQPAINSLRAVGKAALGDLALAHVSNKLAGVHAMPFSDKKKNIISALESTARKLSGPPPTTEETYPLMKQGPVQHLLISSTGTPQIPDLPGQELFPWAPTRIGVTRPGEMIPLQPGENTDLAVPGKMDWQDWNDARKSTADLEDQEINSLLGNLPLRESLVRMYKRSPHKSVLLDTLMKAGLAKPKQ